VPQSCRYPAAISQRLPVPIDCLPIPAEFCRSLLFFPGHYIDTGRLVPDFGGNSAGPCPFFFSIFYWYSLPFSNLFCHAV
jgi:hypothetical protein